MRGENKYLVGKFRAPFRGRKERTDMHSANSYAVLPYNAEIREAEVSGELDHHLFEEVDLLEVDALKDVVIEFAKDLETPVKLFKEDLEGLVIREVVLENVVKDGKKSYGMVSGTVYVPLYGSDPVPTPGNLARARRAREEAERRFRLSMEKLSRKSEVVERQTQPVVKRETIPVKKTAPVRKRKSADKASGSSSRGGFILLVVLLVLILGLFSFGFIAAGLPEVAGGLLAITLLGFLAAWSPKLRNIISVTLVLLMVLGYIIFVIYLITQMN